MDIEEPKEADEAEFRCNMSREPVSVPDFADVAPRALAHADLVYLHEERAHVELDHKTRLPKSASVRFTTEVAIADDGEMSTSDYASAERVSRLSATGFCNPHYLGPDVRRLKATLTPDSGAEDVELRDLRGPAPRPARTPPLVLLVGGREAAHTAVLHRPLSLWTYRLV